MKILDAFQIAIDQEMSNQLDLKIFGQGVWHSFYHGHTLDHLPEKYGKERIRDCPISESAITGMAAGYALSGGRSLVIHPKIDFAIYAMDALTNTMPKWRYFLGQDTPFPITVCFFIKRGGGIGPQQSQSLQAWFAHMPGLKIYYPSGVESTYNTLRWSLNAQDPIILFLDAELLDYNDPKMTAKVLQSKKLTKPKLSLIGSDAKLTIVSYGIMHARTKVLLKKNNLLDQVNLIDLSVLHLTDHSIIIESVKNTKKLLVIEDTWSFCSIGDGVIKNVIKALPSTPLIIDDLHLPFTFAPTAKCLEDAYYISDEQILKKIKTLL
ncbi:MAG: transketolase C-terminal domain-containing protein [Pseudomonadota bacterium]|nr:transketolase C-terminal domain-containing protein [Pseudomonadota bacterium]